MGAFQRLDNIGPSARQGGELTKREPVNAGGWRRQILLYLLHFIIGTLAAFTTGVLLGALAETVLGTSIGDKLFGGPVFAGPVTIGFVAGFFANRSWPTRVAAWVWIPAASWFGWGVKSYVEAGGINYLVHHLLGTGCGGCFEQVLVVCPFYVSLAYSAGAWIALHWPRWPHSSS